MMNKSGYNAAVSAALIVALAPATAMAGGASPRTR
jgi:hypothetical protein